MTNGQRAGARRGMRGHEGVRAEETATGLRLFLGGNSQDVAVDANMTAKEVEAAVKASCLYLIHG